MFRRHRWQITVEAGAAQTPELAGPLRALRIEQRVIYGDPARFSARPVALFVPSVTLPLLEIASTTLPKQIALAACTRPCLSALTPLALFLCLLRASRVRDCDCCDCGAKIADEIARLTQNWRDCCDLFLFWAAPMPVAYCRLTA